MNSVTPITAYSQKVNIKNVTKPNFKSNDTLLTDNVEIQEKTSKGLSNTTKWGIGLGTLAAVVGIGIALVNKANKNHKALVDNIERLCDEKLVLSNLPEKIEWKAAKTLDEAVKFTKETLGIKEVDKNFTLEALNDTNACITDICNLHKGKLYMPTALEYTDSLNENMLACVYKDVRNKDFGKMSINKRYFDRDYLIKELKEHFYTKEGSPVYKKGSRGTYVSHVIKNELEPEFSTFYTEFIDDFYKDASKLSIIDLRILHSAANASDEKVLSPVNYPLKFIKDNLKRLEKNGIKISINDVSKLSKEEQTKILKDALHQLNEKHVFNIAPVEVILPDETIYHEMGHLQDYGKNLKEVFSKSYKDLNSNAIDNRFGSITSNANLRSLFEKDKEQFKKNYPDLYEFLTNQETQELAGQISDYAQSGIGEFIAEFYSKLAKVKKYHGTISEDIMALYKKYNGTII